MGREARLKRQRRERRKLTTKIPPCSHKDCPNNRPPGTHIIRKGDGTFFVSCDDCIGPMMQTMRLEGIDAQVATVEALAMLKPKTGQKKALERFADYKEMDDQPQMAGGPYADDATLKTESPPTEETTADPSGS